MGNSLLYYIGVAFLGGIILNAMPCVLPVLTMKVFHVIEKSKEAPKITRNHGIAYSAGILVTFWALAAVIIGLRAAGERMGWGMQFQNPVFVAVLTTLMFVFALNALGVFEITLGMGGDDSGEGYSASFFNGIFASIMSTPCSAPFLGAAASYALGAEAQWWQTLTMFTMIGLGLGAPFLLISFVPAIGQRLPRPGPWMEVFKQLMGFTLLGAAIWLFSTLLKQVGPDRGADFLYFLLAISVCLWAIQRFGSIQYEAGRRILVHALAAAISIGSGFLFINLEREVKPSAVAIAAAQDAKVNADGVRPAVKDGKINWAPFSPGDVKTSLERGQPVFMDYTADWCLNCKTNEKVFIETETIRGDLTSTQILPMKADFTNEDETIEEWMEKLGRSAIPIYVIYYPDGSHDLLPETISTKMLSEALHKASKKYPPSKFTPDPKAKAAKQDKAEDKPAKVAAEAG